MLTPFPKCKRRYGMGNPAQLATPAARPLAAGRSTPAAWFARIASNRAIPIKA